MRIYTTRSGVDKTVPLRKVPSGDSGARSRLLFEPQGNFQRAGLGPLIADQGR